MTAYDELIAMGVSPTDAAEFKSMDTDTTIAPATTMTPSTTCTNPCTVGGIPMCVSGSGDNKMLTARGCDTEIRTKGYGTDTWYMNDKHLAAGSMHDTASFNPDEITGLKMGIQYKGNASIYTVAPSTTSPTGRCSTYDWQLFPAGVGVSQTEVHCPAKYGMYYWSQWTYETQWDGEGDGPHDGSRATAGVNGVTAPYQYGVSRSRTAWITWWYE